MDSIFTSLNKSSNGLSLAKRRSKETYCRLSFLDASIVGSIVGDSFSGVVWSLAIFCTFDSCFFAKETAMVGKVKHNIIKSTANHRENGIMAWFAFRSCCKRPGLSNITSN